MKLSLFICLALTAFMSFSVHAQVESMFYFETAEDSTTAAQRTGKAFSAAEALAADKDMLVQSDYRRIGYHATFDTETKAVNIDKSFVLAALNPDGSPNVLSTAGVNEPNIGDPTLNPIDPKIITWGNEPPVGDWIQVSGSPLFITFDTEKFSHLTEDDIGNLLIVTLVAATDNNGDSQEAFWSNGRMIDQPPIDIEPPIITCNPYDGTSKLLVSSRLKTMEFIFAETTTKAQASQAIGRLFDNEADSRARNKAMQILVNGCEE